MTLVPGVDTIQGLVGEPPPEIPVEFKTMAKQQALLREWNGLFVAILPYCFKCKMPLVWHIPSDNDELFTCPSCGRVWVKDKAWKGRKK